MRYRIQILESEMLNHNVKRFRPDKPDGFAFEPGQATELSLPREKDLADDKHPFTFTSLPEDSWLEFTIKIYPEHEVWELGPGCKFDRFRIRRRTTG